MVQSIDEQRARIRARFIKQQQEVNKHTKASRYIALTLGAMVITIYAYSMYTVKQETVLREIDDIVESEK